jgi:apolipoprotein N-acyltransferase
VFSGFGWSALGYSQGNNPYMLQWGAIGTVAAASFLLVLTNGLVADAIGRTRRAAYSFVAAIAVVGAAHGIGYLLLKPSMSPAEPFRVGVLQPNFSLEMKWDREYRYETIRNAAEKSVALARQGDIDLMVWPEALILVDIDEPGVADMLATTAREGGFSLFAGASRTDAGRNYNWAVMIDEQGKIAGGYDKIHLAPFGEYVPFSDYLPFVDALVPSIGDISPGQDVRVLPVDGRRLGPLICFEMLFAPMSNRLRREGADFLAVITNLAWFGRSNAIPQEFEISRMRAVETRLPLIHASNTGISGVFDPYGRFTPVDLLADHGPNLYPIRPDLPLDALIMARLAGVFELPQAAPQPLIQLHRWLPWAIHAIAAALLLIGALLPAQAAAPRPTRPRRG